MWTYASDVFIEFEHELIAATRYGQIAMEFIRQWLEEVNLDMTFDRDDIADSWSPRSGIELNPHIQFGEPCVKGTDIPTKALWSKIRAGDPPSVVASLYEIEESSVRDAVAWEKSLAEAA